MTSIIKDFLSNFFTTLCHCFRSQDDAAQRSEQEQGSNWITGVTVGEPRPYFPIRLGQNF